MTRVDDDSTTQATRRSTAWAVGAILWFAAGFLGWVTTWPRGDEVTAQGKALSLLVLFVGALGGTVCLTARGRSDRP